MEPPVDSIYSHPYYQEDLCQPCQSVLLQVEMRQVDVDQILSYYSPLQCQCLAWQSTKPVSPYEAAYN